MSEVLIQFFVTVFALLATNYIHAAIFSYFKADRYEGTLAKKVADEVVKRLKEKPFNRETE